MTAGKDGGRWIRELGFIMLCAAATPWPLMAQDRVERCAGGDVTLQAACRGALLGLEAARAFVGLSLSGGADLPGTTSTLGKRIGDTPRLGLAVRAGVTRGSLPGPAGAIRSEETVWLHAVRTGIALGLFDGFSLAPTIGGLFSLDLLGEGGVSLARESHGFDRPVTAGGVGVRVGVFRESFTLPGVTVTATRRWSGEVTFVGAGATSVADQGGGADFSTTATSVRATVGKEFFALGILGGVGWDRYEGDGTVRIDPTLTSQLRSVEAGGLRAERFLVFGGASYNLLILQLSGELGWAGGLDGPLEQSGSTGEGVYDPAAEGIFGALALRLIF